MIFHGFRYNLRKRWYWSPHFHVLGFIRGGYGRCRGCKRKNNCLKGCGGFDDRNYHEGFLKDGYVVKVLGKRKSVYHTAWYQLNHATVRVGLRRFHMVTWFGCCGNRKYSSAKFILKAEDVCPVCGGEMVRCFHAGKRRIVKDVGYVACFVDDEFDECGKPNYVEVVGSRGFGGSGSYG